MLKVLSCDNLIKNKLIFNKGLNSLVGPDNGANSIGKSSVLMLIDFALSGDDFIKLCADAIENVGAITVKMEFLFDDITYLFSRSTNDPKVVIFYEKDQELEKPISEYRKFLKEKYLFPDGSTSFRGAVNPFFRIWGKDNYNPNKPLNSFPSETFSSIKSNLLKMFSLYSFVQDLEKEKNLTQNKKTVLKGAFDQGYLIPLTKKELKDKKNILLQIDTDLKQIKGSLEAYAINANQLINEESLNLKLNKDNLISIIFQSKRRLQRVADNLNYGSSTNKKYFEKLKDFFPDVDESKLGKIDQFHSGVTKLLKAELRNEKMLLEEKIHGLEGEVHLIDIELIKNVTALDQPSELIDKMLDLSLEQKKLTDQVRFREIKETIDTKVNNLSDEISQKVVLSLSSIEKQLNDGMSFYIGKFFKENPIEPEIRLTETRYDFKHNDDSGTGKAYANMIAMDMCFLGKTYLPFLIHDLIVFKNIEVHAIEKIIEVYVCSNKQIFIAIDELSRYSTKIQKLILESEFLKLDSQQLAFGKSWKKRT